MVCTTKPAECVKHNYCARNDECFDMLAKSKPRSRYKLKLCHDRIRVRDHTMPNGYRCFNHYYYQ
jgi:hypothetical protein